jgi:plastocyanin
VACVAVLAVAVVPAMGASSAPAPKPRIVSVTDDLFTPGNLTVAKNKLVKWVWDSSNTDTHNVVLTKGPKGVKKADFKSADGSIGIRFQRRLAVPGTYKFICTIHPTVMKQTITVKR